MFTGMEKFNALSKVMILVCFSVNESFSACYNEHNDFVEGFLGRNVTLRCRQPVSCKSIHWMNHTGTFISSHDTSHTSISRRGRTSFLHIYGMILDDAGPYKCWCYKQLGASGDAFCSVNLSGICQATVRLHRVNFLYNGSSISPSSSQAVSVTAEDIIKVMCSEGASPETNCHRVKEKDPSARFTYNFKVLPEHHSCYIACIERGRVGNVCTVNITLHVSMRETTTPFSTLSTTPSTECTKFVEKTVHTSTSPGFNPSLGFVTILQCPSENESEIVTDKPGTFPVIILVGVLIFILLAVAFVVWLWILLSKSKSNSRSKKTINSVSLSSDARIPIGPIYASVNKSSQAPKTEDGESVTTYRKASSVEDFYSEVNSAGKESSATQQANTARAESSITNDCHSVVDTSNATMRSVKNVNESDNIVYSEVIKRDKQSRKNKYPSSSQSSVCDPIVSHPNQGLEQPTLSDNNTVCDISSPQALYAVVGRDKGKK
ncbi:hypothetical protein HOLleu_24684 [Holothuria leucospilota]|uniref:Immunoglobulin domain-containing protein n=1 Tax=Holothuria leucospilota TaxID=206669 RepID=A0A9Q1BRK7_HOLLE|nr:hypothetical protein HOLleu_24684 [Holothuria leucospilota]